MKRSAGLEGIADIERMLGELPANIAKGAARRSLRRGGEVFAERARELAPDDPTTPNANDPQDLKTSIKVASRQATGRSRRRTREGGDEALAWVGPTKEGFPQAIMQEFGTAEHEAQPYMRPAWEEKQDEALSVITKDLGPEILKTAQRLAKRLAKLGR